MSHWERLMQLPAPFTQQLHDLYDREGLPMEVRHYLAAWIESQQWQRAIDDYNLAMVLFQALLENLDIQYSRFVQDKSVLMQHNFRRYKQNFQRYLDNPQYLANTFSWFLEKEKDILRNADLAEQVQALQVEQGCFETSTQRDLDRRMASLKYDVQCMEHTMVCLEEQQDEFDFKYQTYLKEAPTTSNAADPLQAKFQFLINKLNDSRKNTLVGLHKLLDRAEDLIDALVNKEMVQWQRRQQKSCIGAPERVDLDQLEKWFTCAAECLFQVCEFLSKLEELAGKMTYDNDPVKSNKPFLQRRTLKLLTDLLKSSFVVENQPSMPQGKGPLVLRTGVQFPVKTRLLVKFPELNHSMKVDISMDRDAPQIKGYRHFNVLGTTSKDLNMSENGNGGMVAEFRHLTLKEQKSNGGGKGTSDISLSVTEELHILYFNTTFKLKGISVGLQATSLPVVIISNSSQQQSAWASVLWFNLLSQDPKDVTFFANSPAATWPQFGEMLSWQFLFAERGLNDAQLEMIAHRLFGKQQSYENSSITWSKFSKENSPETFWVWFDSIVVMVETYLKNLWRDGIIMGFVTKCKEKMLLKKKQKGTFLIRFSESVIGGITFSWVEIGTNGDPEVKTIQPFTKKDLSQIPFHEIVRHFLILKEVPQNPLLYLYPDIPKDEAFGKYYADKSGNDSPYLKYIKTSLVFVLKGDTLAAVTDGEVPQPLSGLHEEDAGQLKDSPDPHLANCQEDPLLYDPILISEEDLQYPSISNHFFDSDIFVDELPCGL
ncbi:signal transducer and activator of transcription 2 [Syngnathus typhle]|uniref:signal transducer and activator of transcription 2 n=1 Tax=Syngnathus typhle TaxID=161592 RepID=UPI002A6A26EF|nr:signal transducer and activator of transcription 2 [Syngnathus typhle]